MGARRLILASVGVVLGVLAFSVAPAFAATGYGLLASFASGQNVGATPVGLAVDDSSSTSAGDVYVTDGEVVNRYTAAEAAVGATTPTLAPLTKFGYAYGVAVDPSNGDVYVADAAGTVHKFSASGATISFSLSGATVAAPLGIAVNPTNGNVLVGDGATNTVFEFTSAGVFTGKEYIVATAAPVGIAVNAAGDVFVAAQGAGTLKFTAPGAISEAFATSDANGVAIDAAGDVFVAGGGQASEYDSTGKQVGQVFGTGVLAEAYGVGLSTAATPLVYVADNALNDASVFDTGETPEAPVTEAATVVTSASATLGGEVAGTGTGKAKYDFVYNTNGSCEGGSTTVPVEVAGAHQKVAPTTVTGLAPGMRYTFCLVVTNAFGSALGSPLSFTTLAQVESESVSNVTAASASLEAGIAVGASGGETTYRFEYGTSEAYGQSTQGSAPVGGERAVDVEVQGLVASTTYHYRVVLINAQSPAGADGPDRTFTTQPVGGPLRMLDGRQWELVSPPNKHGSGIEALTREGGEIQAAVDGSAFTYVATGPVTSEAKGNLAPELAQVFSRRAASGWETQDIATPKNETSEYQIGGGSEYKLFSPDLSVGLTEPRDNTPLSPEANGKTLYLRDDETGGYTPLVTPINVYESRPFGNLEFVGATPDLSHVVFSSPDALTSEVTAYTGKNNLYEWSAGKLVLVSVLPDGHPASEAPGEGYGPEDAYLGRFGRRFDRNAVSVDGSRVVWSTLQGPLYLRDMAKKETVRLDNTDTENLGEVGFQGASSDGSRIFFTDTYPLTSDSHSEEGQGDVELYVAEVVPGAHLAVTVTDMTAHTVNGEPGSVRESVLGYSEDGSTVYYVAGGQLTKDAGPGADKLYMAHYENGTWVQRYITSLSGEKTNGDKSDWGSGADELYLVTSRVSSDGRFLAFMSREKLTGYDNRDAVSGEPDHEVYLYDADLNRLVCASCDPTGARPVGIYDSGVFPGLLVDQDHVAHEDWLAGSIPGWTENALGETNFQSRYLSDSGRLFFDSADALVPQDINGLEDVYEYELEGTGSCEKANTTDGCVGLISSGASADESAFLDASETGDDAFFLTSSKLVSQDYDKEFDVYDAHACGEAVAPSPGWACASSVAEPPACTTADSCRSAVSPQPAIFGAPPSATFSGAGNVLPIVVSSGIARKGKTLTRAQKLALALKTCIKKAGRKRASCEVTAQKKYGKRAVSGANSGRRAK